MVILTPIQWEIIEHRLSLCDALAEVMADSEYGTITEASEAAELLYKSLSNTRTFNAAELTQLQKEILKDCIDGSTFFNNGMLDEVALCNLSRGKVLAWQKAARQLETIFAAHGMKAVFPDY